MSIGEEETLINQKTECCFTATDWNNNCRAAYTDLLCVKLMLLFYEFMNKIHKERSLPISKGSISVFSIIES